MSKNQEIAARVLKAVGGEGNVNSVVHCATRLRFKLKDENKADTAALNADRCYSGSSKCRTISSGYWQSR